MRITVTALVLFAATCVYAQVGEPPAAANSAPPPGVAQPADLDLVSLLPGVQQVTQEINVDLARLRIEKWKANSTRKKQAQDNSDSVSRNLTTALPAIMDEVRANPQSLAAGFKLYRNLSALHNVLEVLNTSADAFGSRSEYEKLTTDAANLDRLRRTIGDKLDKSAAARDAEVVSLRSQLAQAKAAPPPPPKKIVIDDQEPPPSKTPARKKAKKPETPNPPPTVPE